MKQIHQLLRSREQGVGLVELMVALVLSLFLLAGLFTIFFSTKSSYNDQQALAALQDNQTLASTILADTVRAAGYFPYSSTGLNSRDIAFPANGTWAAGQVVYATGTTAGPDDLYVRLIPSQPLNCIGANGNTAQTNNFTIINTAASPHSLACSVVQTGSAAQTSALVSPLASQGMNPSGGGVQNIQVKIGVSTSGGSSVDRYYAPSSMPAGGWLNARSVVVRLTFFNPLFDDVHTAAGTNVDSQGQPRYLTMTRVIRLENLQQ